MPPTLTGTFTEPGVAFTVPWHDTYWLHTGNPIDRRSLVSRTPASIDEAAHAARHQRGGEEVAEHPVCRRRGVDHDEDVAGLADLDRRMDHDVVAGMTQHGDCRAGHLHVVLDRPEVRPEEATAPDRFVHGRGTDRNRAGRRCRVVCVRWFGRRRDGCVRSDSRGTSQFGVETGEDTADVAVEDLLLGCFVE